MSEHEYANQMAEMNSFLNLPEQHQHRQGNNDQSQKRQIHSYPNSVSPPSPSVHSMSLVGTPKMAYDEFLKQQNQHHHQQQLQQHQQQQQQERFDDYSFWNDFIEDDRHSPANHVSPTSSDKPLNSSVETVRYPFDVEVKGITPNEMFQSPLSGPMDPQTQNLANVYDDGSFTPLLSPAVSSFDPPIPGHSLNFAMPNAFLSLDSADTNASVQQPQIQPSSAASSRKRGNARAPPRGATKPRSGRATPVGGTPVMGPQSSRVAKMSPMSRPSGRASSRAGSLSGPNSVGGSPLVNPMVSVSNKDSWSSDSISPESLPDIVMPPPQTRPLAPTLNSTGPMKPATPSTLMDLPKGQTEDIDMKDSHSALEDAIRVTRNLSSSRSSVASTMSDATISPNTSVSSTASTPQIAAKRVSTSKKGSNGNGGKIAPQGRRSSSVSASPALMPKISPQIKPLASDQSLDYQTLLATKSNYQNIVEGKHSALGLQYPEHLSVNIASKRTSHKLAEQGRRNRINNALADLGKLLVPESASTSKANTVENAIEYIHKLKAELAEANTRANQMQAFLQAKNLLDEYETTMGVLVKKEDSWQPSDS